MHFLKPILHHRFKKKGGGFFLLLLIDPYLLYATPPAKKTVPFFTKNAYFNYLQAPHYKPLQYDMLDDIYTAEATDPPTLRDLSVTHPPSLYQPICAARTLWLTLHLLEQNAVDFTQGALFFSKFQMNTPENIFVKKTLEDYVATFTVSPSLLEAHPLDPLILLFHKWLTLPDGVKDIPKDVKLPLKEAIHKLLAYTQHRAEKTPPTKPADIFYTIFANDVLAFLYLVQICPSLSPQTRLENYCKHITQAEKPLLKFYPTVKKNRKKFFSEHYLIFQDLKKKMQPNPTPETTYENLITALEENILTIKLEQNNFFLKHHMSLSHHIHALDSYLKKNTPKTSEIVLLRAHILKLFLTIGHPKDIIKNFSMLFHILSDINEAPYLEYEKIEIQLQLEEITKKNEEKKIFLQKAYLYFLLTLLKASEKNFIAYTNHNEILKKHILYAVQNLPDLNEKDYTQAGSTMLQSQKDNPNAMLCFECGEYYLSTHTREQINMIYYYESILSLLDLDQHSFLIQRYIQKLLSTQNLYSHQKIAFYIIDNTYALFINKHPAQRERIQKNFKFLLQKISQYSWEEKKEVMIWLQRLLHKFYKDPLLSIIIFFYTEQWYHVKRIGMQTLEKTPIPHPDVTLDLISYYTAVACHHLNKPMEASRYLSRIMQQINNNPNYELHGRYDSISKEKIYTTYADMVELQEPSTAREFYLKALSIAPNNAEYQKKVVQLDDFIAFLESDMPSDA